MNIKFTCLASLKDCFDSMLFESGTVIAKLDYQTNDGYLVHMELRVSGHVKVKYDGNCYTNPSLFPNDLIDDIRTGSYWSTYDNIEVIENNWFEYCCIIKNESKNIDDEFIDVEENDISKEDKISLKNKMITIAENYIKGYGNL